MMDAFIHWQKPYHLLSTTCDGILSWMVQIWIKNQLISDNNCNIVDLYNALNFLQGMTNSVGLTLVLVTLYRGLQLILSKTIRFGDMKYHI